jgi:hypothetical protein
MVPEVILAWSAAIIAVGGALGILWRIVTPVVVTYRRITSSVDLFMKDWFGEPGDEFHPKKAGMLERISSVEAELKHNGGSSIKDAVKRIETKLVEIDARLDEGARKFEYIEEELESKDS